MFFNGFCEINISLTPRQVLVFFLEYTLKSYRPFAVCYSPYP
jgi:hypothetical protein